MELMFTVTKLSQCQVMESAQTHVNCMDQQSLIPVDYSLLIEMQLLFLGKFAIWRGIQMGLPKSI